MFSAGDARAAIVRSVDSAAGATDGTATEPTAAPFSVELLSGGASVADVGAGGAGAVGGMAARTAWYRVGCELAEDHKPALPCERRRLDRIGAAVVNDRVAGVLAVSRALGDFNLKPDAAAAACDQPVCCLPVVRVAPRQRRTPAGSVAAEVDRLLLVGCDGVWEAQTASEVARRVLAELHPVVGVSEAALASCSVVHPATGEGGSLLPGNDNVTLLAIDFGA
jgi:hypothetical protein